MKTSILYLIVTLSISCHRLKELTVNEVTGTYITENNFYGVGAKLKIKRNETFEYSWRTGLIAGETYGTWEIKKIKINFK